MKKIILLIWLFINIFILKAQNNLIPNPGFESGFTNPQCNNGNSYSTTPIQNDIYDWKIATCSSGPFTCQYQYSAPDWMDPTFCSLNFGIQSRYVYLEKNFKKGFQDALRTGLLANMNPAKKYIFKISYTATTRKSGSYTSSNPARTTIHFTKYSKHWNAGWGNTRIEFTMYPPITFSAAGNSSGWIQDGFIIDAPYMSSLPTASNLFSKLNNIVLDCSDNQVLIDYVELSEVCQSPIIARKSSI